MDCYFNFFLIFIFTLFYFTILYWFCHTLTCIRHGCTWVPNPGPPSHLPPHIISLDHPHALAPSILYSASNIDWRFISYMIVYMFQCHSPKSSHPLPLPQSPKVCSTHLYLFCCLAYRVIETDFILGGSKITADGDCSQKIKRCLLLERKVMTNLDSIFTSRDITLPTKVHLFKTMVFPVVMYGCESWTVKKAEHQRIDAFNCGVGEDSLESFGLQGDPTSPF